MRGHEEPPRMRDQLIAGPPPRQHEHERSYATIHSNKATTKGDYNGQMIFGDLVGLKLSNICFKGEKKNLTQETSLDWGSNPDPLRDRRACYRLLHSDGRRLRFYFIKIN